MQVSYEQHPVFIMTRTIQLMLRAKLTVLLITGLAASWGKAETSGAFPRSDKLEAAQDLIEGIYRRGDFRGRTFRGEWLPDSSGYLVLELDGELKKRRLFRYDVEDGTRTEWDGPNESDSQRNGNLSPDGKREIEVRRGNLNVRAPKDGKPIKLTSNKEDGSIRIHQPQWSPDSSRIAFVQSDQSEVRLRRVLVPGDPSYPGLREDRFARVGGAIPKLKVGVADLAADKVQWINIAEPDEDFYLGLVEWAGNSDELLIEKLSRFRDRREFFLVDVVSGKSRILFAESDPAWVVASVAKNSGLEWIEDGEAFVVISEKDGWRHAYRYGRDGRNEVLLTPGEYDIIERAGIDEEREWYYFYASPENGTQKYLYRVPLEGGGEAEPVTPEGREGTHHYVFSPDARWAFHTHSSFDTPPVTELLTLPDHKVVRVLEANEPLMVKLTGLIHQPTEFFQVDIGNEVVIDGWMIKPPGFDPKKKYPTIVYVYGEPHGQTVLDSWNAAQGLYHRAVAELGYLVVSMDNRGTPAPKGAAWRRAVAGSLGPLSTKEQADGMLKLAESRPFVDTSRVGIWGWSGGGSNTLNALFRKPEVYQVGIAVVPKPQPHLYNAWFQEMYMETRETNPEGYHRSAPINFAEGLKGDLLIIHGTGETNTHLEIVEGLVDRLIELGKPFDYMAYPNRNHGISEGKGTMVHMRMHMIRYWLDHLPSDAR